MRIAAPAGSRVLPRFEIATAIHAEIDGAPLLVQAVRFDALRDHATGLPIVEDDRLEIGGRKVRRRVVRLPERRGGPGVEPPRDVLRVAVQAPCAISLFQHEAPDLETQRRVVMDAVSSFDVEPP